MKNMHKTIRIRAAWLTMLLITSAAAVAGQEANTLQPALEYAKDNASTSLLVLQKGKLLAEGHWQIKGSQRFRAMKPSTNADGESIEDVASIQKSVVSYLVGIAVGKGLLDIETTVSRWLGAGWSAAARDKEDKILIRHLLSMTSGLKPDGTYVAPAGERWAYNTRVYSRLVGVLEAASESTIDHISQQWLLEPAGMKDSGWAKRTWIRGDADANRLGFRTTARDLALFGQLLLQQLRGETVSQPIDPDYLRNSLAPSQTLNRAYGYLWWLNGQPVARRGGAVKPTLLAAAPADLFAAQGALGRKLYIVPSLDLIVVRMGDAPPDKDFEEQLWRRIMQAL
ncbi:MAG: serine hydrolase [Pseudomonadales bacterium]